MKKEVRIDILKVVGLLCIILAHTNPPKLLFQIRNFDVVLMILVSSYLGLKSAERSNTISSYILKRFNRLVVPTWIFLTLFFVLAYFFGICEITKRIVVTSFRLQDGIGYIWIIRIYFIVSVLCLLHKKLLEKSIYQHAHIILAIILYIIYEILCHYGMLNSRISMYLFAYIIPCYILIIVSKSLFELNNKKVFIIGITSFIILISIGLYLYIKTGIVQQTQTMKYPFRLYYLSYGVFVSSILILITNVKEICNTLNNKLTMFISNHSLWIYLWHILILYCMKGIRINWLLKYVIIVVISLIITYMQSILISKIENKKNKHILKIFKG